MRQCRRDLNSRLPIRQIGTLDQLSYTPTLGGNLFNFHGSEVFALCLFGRLFCFTTFILHNVLQGVKGILQTFFERREGKGCLMAVLPSKARFE